jgi:hypothetical protein
MNCYQLLTKSEEDSRVVRRTVAEAVGSLAVLTLPLGTWPEFLPSLFQLSTSTVRRIKVSIILVSFYLSGFIFTGSRSSYVCGADFGQTG